MADDTPIPFEPVVLTIDAREAFEVIVTACAPFAGKIGGGVQILAALMELFDETLKKAPADVQQTFWTVMNDKRERALAIINAENTPPDRIM